MLVGADDTHWRPKFSIEDLALKFNNPHGDQLMRAVVMHEYGDANVLRLVEQPVPKPGPHDLLVEVHATSVNNIDLRMRRSQSSPRKLPITLGFDASGVVASCG